MDSCVCFLRLHIAWVRLIHVIAMARHLNERVVREMDAGRGYKVLCECRWGNVCFWLNDLGEDFMEKVASV